MEIEKERGREGEVRKKKRDAFVLVCVGSVVPCERC
jgi:hypothetical protein